MVKTITLQALYAVIITFVWRDCIQKGKTTTTYPTQSHKWDANVRKEREKKLKAKYSSGTRADEKKE